MDKIDTEDDLSEGVVVLMSEVPKLLIIFMLSFIARRKYFMATAYTVLFD